MTETGGDFADSRSVEADKFFALYGDSNGDGLVSIQSSGDSHSLLANRKTNQVIENYSTTTSMAKSASPISVSFRNRFGRPKLAF